MNKDDVAGLVERLDASIIGCHDDKSEWGKLRVGDLMEIKNALTALSARVEALEALQQDAERLRDEIRKSGVKRNTPGLYGAVMRFDVSAKNSPPSPSRRQSWLK